MARNSARQFRRSAAQLHALASVERTISAADTVSRCRYLKEYSEAFQTYESVLMPGELDDDLRPADIILIGDYHALSAAQAYAASILDRLSHMSSRPVLFCLEAVLARDQRILDEWFRNEIEIEELRERIRFDQDWGYDWRPYRELLESARKVAAGVFGIDCPPRSDMRTIARRDRHASLKIAQLREQYPEAVIVVLFGESHLAPNHLPALLRNARPADRVLTILQNVDSLYWQAAGEPGESVGAVRVGDGVVCAFTSTPLEKYENYRLYIEQWQRERPSAPDMAPSFYNLIESLTRFLNFPVSGIQSLQSLPEVSCTRNHRLIRNRLARVGMSTVESDSVLSSLRFRGSCYVAEVRTIFAFRFLMPEAAEEAARFVHHACQTDSASFSDGRERSAEDEFYVQVIDEAVAYLGSKILCPGRVVTCVPNAALRLGQMLATRIYLAYVAGKISKRFLRSVFCTPIRRPGAARVLYFSAVSILNGERKRSSATQAAQMVS
ncbi:MAG TPA: ChaN family lipoprotein [Terriglobales bacterium]|nr:ChaN family lipoprotein [Terriglobales bacterium]